MIRENFIRKILRKMLVLLSFFYHSEKYKEDQKLLTFLSNLGKKIKNKKNHKKRDLIHKIFSRKILELVISKKIGSFLREDFIQQMFFVHNRLYINKELNYLKSDTDNNWNTWKKLLLEDKIGNPIKYFLYPQSSGNRIRQVFHLKKFKDFSKNKLNSYNVILEIGGGYGNMACLFNKINKNMRFIIFDTEEVGLIQYYYLKMNKIKVSFGYKKNSNVNIIHNVKDLKYALSKLKLKKNKNNLLISNWGLSEMPINLRMDLKPLILLFNNQLISFQNKFGSVNNCSYFESLKKEIGKKMKTIAIFEEIKTMAKMISFTRDKHFYFFVKKNSL